MYRRTQRHVAGPADVEIDAKGSLLPKRPLILLLLLLWLSLWMALPQHWHLSLLECPRLVRRARRHGRWEWRQGCGGSFDHRELDLTTNRRLAAPEDLQSPPPSIQTDPLECCDCCCCCCCCCCYCCCCCCCCCWWWWWWWWWCCHGCCRFLGACACGCALAAPPAPDPTLTPMNPHCCHSCCYPEAAEPGRTNPK